MNTDELVEKMAKEGCRADLKEHGFDEAADGFVYGDENYDSFDDAVDSMWRLWMPAMRAALAVVPLRDAELEAQLTASRNLAQNHAETLRSIRAMPDSDGERMKLWAADGLSGYTAPVESTLLQQSDKIAELEARCATMREAVEAIAGSLDYAGRILPNKYLRDMAGRLYKALAEGGNHG